MNHQIFLTTLLVVSWMSSVISCLPALANTAFNFFFLLRFTFILCSLWPGQALTILHNWIQISLLSLLGKSVLFLLTVRFDSSCLCAMQWNSIRITDHIVLNLDMYHLLIVSKTLWRQKHTFTSFFFLLILCLAYHRYSINACWINSWPMEKNRNDEPRSWTRKS